MPVISRKPGGASFFRTTCPQNRWRRLKKRSNHSWNTAKPGGAAKENYYKEVLGPDGYQPGETKNDFLKRFGRPWRCRPEKFPYYALIIGDPETIPFSFQYQLDIQYATGRIHFDKLEDYYSMQPASSERKPGNRPPQKSGLLRGR